jgi:diacylglycerol kinase family enzyme
MSNRRTAAIAALLVGTATVVFAVAVAVDNFPNGLVVLACLALTVVLGWYGIRRRGPARVVGLSGAAIALVGSLALLLVQGSLAENVIVLAGVAVTVGAAASAFAIRPELPRATRPEHPVLFMNPRSGGGKATKFNLAEEARKRGIEPVVLRPGDDLWKLVRDAVAGGADALAMAGGDGSQAIVAAVAAEEGLPYACIPAGTRNHFALDLGVDRDDVVGALEAFVDGGERVVDLAEVNGRVFVNNVSLGLYAEAVQQEGYRDAKIRTILETVPDVLGPDGKPLDLQWTGPDGALHESAATILVSNNRYRLGKLVGSGTRPRMDEHVLGVAAVQASDSDGKPLLEWTVPEFSVGSHDDIAAGIDGEAVKLTPPVSFRMRPDALRVRIAPAHPGASPSAAEPGSLGAGIARLFSIAAGSSDRGDDATPPARERQASRSH